MEKVELLNSLNMLNQDEVFYRNYQTMKRDPRLFRQYIDSLSLDYLLEKHYVIPETKETIPPYMKDDFFNLKENGGMIALKHNCFSPAFPHKHSYFEIFYVYEGFCMHKIGEKEAKLYKGDFCIIPPNVEHTISVQDQSIIIDLIVSADALKNVFMNPAYNRKNKLSDFFTGNIRGLNEDSYILFHTGNDNEIQDLVIKLMLETVNKYPEYEVILYSGFGILFAHLIRYYESTIEYSFKDKTTDTMYNILTYIQNNHSNITLQTLAKEFGYTSEYMSRFIKLNTNRSFTDILIEYRLEHAISLMKDSHLTISEISYQIGYENTENFIRNFKKKYGITPSVYRKQLNKK